MKRLILLSFICVIIFVIVQSNESEKASFYLKDSVPYIGADIPKKQGYDGSGIKIALIDTGVDYKHPDLFGFGENGKVEGVNFVEKSKMPIDINGHGTQVAGIIAADGNLKGVAPKAKIISYKVSNDGESVSSELIVKAIKQAIKDDVNIINISLGVNKTNSQIDHAVNEAIDKGIVVVTAAGNDGPDPESIGSPGINPNAITVGATYNNLTSSLVATLEIGNQIFQVIPMVGTKALDEPITAQIVFGKYGRMRDFETGNFAGKIVLVERGSDVKDEIVYFSDKEFNAAQAGAKAVIVYNNEEGIFLGELIHEFADPNYRPTIPTVSMSREDGLKIKDMLENKTQATLNVFYNPDFVAYFSSRGPVSPFYNKPDMVAPGVFVNSTTIDGKYNFTSGTSFAAPHVSGAAALLLQKNPEFTPQMIKSILVTTADPVTDAYGRTFPIEVAGSGRLNVTKAFDAKLVIYPTFLTFDVSPLKTSDTQILKLKAMNNDTVTDIHIIEPEGFDFDYKIQNETLTITAKMESNMIGEYEGRIFLTHDKVQYNIPFKIRATEAALLVKQDQGILNFEIKAPFEWSFAKITAINSKTLEKNEISITPSSNDVMKIFQAGLYWIEGKITSNQDVFTTFEKVNVVTPAKKESFDVISEIPIRPIAIVISISVVIALFAIKFKRQT